MSQSSGMTFRETGSRERVGWAVLLASFVIWASVIVALPLLASRYLQVSTKPLDLVLQANEGTVRLETDGEASAMFSSDPETEIESPIVVVTSMGDAATLLVYEPDEGQLLGRLQVYGSTAVEAQAAQTPRFSVSKQDRRLLLKLDHGRLRLKLPPSEDRPFVVEIETPQGNVRLAEAGQYSVEVSSGDTHVLAVEGMAELEAAGVEVMLGQDERGIIGGDGAITGPLTSERSLVRNGDFQDQLQGWDELSWNVELADQPQGETSVTELAGESALRFHRVGEGHADSGVRQTIGQDVSDMQALRIELSFRIVNHSVAVCGSLGSECPITVRIEYDDADGNGQVWQQGFYAEQLAQVNGVPDVCVSCAPPRPEHELVPAEQFAFYRADLLTLLPQFGMVLPSRINSISILTAGHSFDVNVMDVNLIVEE